MYTKIYFKTEYDRKLLSQIVPIIGEMHALFGVPKVSENSRSLKKSQERALSGSIISNQDGMSQNSQMIR